MRFCCNREYLAQVLEMQGNWLYAKLHRQQCCKHRKAVK